MEIKVRAWDNHEKRWAKTHEIEGELFINPEVGDTGVFYIHDHSASGKLHYTLVRSTTLRDRHGKEIWEGDRVRWHDPHIDCDDIIENITFQNGAFCHGGLPLHQISMMSLEVIGSIYGEGE